MNNETSDGGATVPCISLLADDSQFRCTVCGQIGTVGRCCGLDTREPLNDLARAELVAEENCKANDQAQLRTKRSQLERLVGAPH
jgi:hypothetical protein